MPCSGFYRLIVANEDDASQFDEGTRRKKGLLKANMAFSSPSLAYWGCVIEFPALRLNGKSGEVLSWSCTQEDDLAVTCEPEDLRIKGFRDLG